MKIVHIYKTSHPETFGGIENLISDLSSGLKSYGIDSFVCASAHTKNKKIVEYRDIKIHLYPVTIEKYSCPISLSLLADFKNIIKEVDLIHYHFPWPFADLMNLIRHHNKPYIVTYHSDIVRQKKFMPLYRPLMSHFLNHAKSIVATSENYLATSEVLKKYKEKVKVIPLALADMANQTYSTEAIDIHIKKPYFLFIGVLREYKGLRYLLRAMQGMEHFQLIIAGSGPCRSECESLIRALNLKNVILFGDVSGEKKQALFQQALGIVIPSYLRSEAYCYSLLEGLMFGKPLISAEIGTGTSFVNQHNKTGFVVKPESPDELRSAMNKIYDDEPLRKQFSLAARQRYCQHFQLDTMINRYYSLYCESLHAKEELTCQL